MELTKTKTNIERSAKLIKNADAILIGAGAGLSAAAGIDYTDPKRFARLFPQMHKLGFQNNYELMGYAGLPDRIMWGYLAMHVQHVAYEMQQHEVYGRLFGIIKEKDYFVMTSNVDRMFYKNGFDPARIYTPQGSYTRMQCRKPCSKQTWDTRLFLDPMLEALDPLSHQITNPSAIPRCPNCGGPMFMNVRGGNWFIEQPYEEARQRFQQWVEAHLQKPLLVIELGAGFNTPGVIRWPMEKITDHNPQATMIRFNRDHPELPAEIKDRGIGIPLPIDRAIQDIDATIVKTDKLKNQTI